MSSQIVCLLIAEDEESIRVSMESYIRKNTKWIDEIYTASNGQETLDMILRYRPQIMVLDIQMPVKDGLSVLREALAAGVCPRTVILSGHDQFGYAQQALRFGVADYFLKPCRAAEILSRVDDLAREARGLDASPATEEEETHINRIVSLALNYMEKHYPEDLTLSSVAENIGISPNYLSSLFGKTLSAGFADTLNKIRIDRACDYFAAGGLRTYEVAYKVGFHDEKYFSSVFKKLKGKSPSKYKEHKGV